MRALRHVAAALALALVFATSLVAGALLHLDVPLVRRVLEARGNRALASIPGSTISVHGLEHAGLLGVRVRTVDAAVGSGWSARATGVVIDVDWPRLVWQLARGRLGRVDVRRVEVVSLDLRVSPAEPAERGEGGAPGARPGRAIELVVERARLLHGWVHGALDPRLALDVDLDGVDGRLAKTAEALRVAGHGRAAVRAVAPSPIVVQFDTLVDEPVGEARPRSIAASATLDLAGATAQVKARLEGETLAAWALVPGAAPEVVRELVPYWPLDAPVRVSAAARGALSSLSVAAAASSGRARLAVEGRARLLGSPALDLALDLRDLTLDGVELAPVEAQVALDTMGLRAHGTVAEPGAPVDFRAARAPRGALHVRASCRVDSLARVPRLGRLGVHGSGSLSLAAEGTVGRTLHATVSAEGRELASSGVSSKLVEVAGTLEGDPRRPLSRIDLAATSVALGSATASSLRVLAVGPPGKLRVDATLDGGTFEHAALSGALALAGRPRLSDVRGELRRRGATVGVSADAIAFGEGTLEVERMTATGLGEPVELGLLLSPRRARGTLFAPGVDLARSGALLGLSSRRASGSASIGVTFDNGPTASTLHATGRISASGLGPFAGFAAIAAVDVERGGVTVTANAAAGGLGDLAVTARGRLGGATLSEASLRGALGSAVVSTNRIALGSLCTLVRCPPSLSGLDMTARGRVAVDRTSPSGEGTHVVVTASLDDPAGRFATLAVDTDLDPERVLARRELPDTAPLHAVVTTEPRPIERLPWLPGPLGLRGPVRARADASGTLGRPLFSIQLRGDGLVAAEPPRARIDVDWVTTYDAHEAVSTLRARANGALVVDATASAAFPLADWVAGSTSRARGGFVAHLDALPLAWLPPLADRHVAGLVSGRLSAGGLGEAPAALAELSVDRLAVGDTPVGALQATARADEHRGSLALRAGREGGHASLVASAGLAWRSAVLPAIDPGSGLDATLELERFPASALEPLAAGSLQRLGGTLDARVQVGSPAAPSAARTLVVGDATVTGGRVYWPLLGRELSALDVHASSDGALVTIDRASGRLAAGRFSAVASMGLSGARPTDVRADVSVPRGEPVPLVLEGVSYGTAWGRAVVDARVTGRVVRAHVALPELRVALPERERPNLQPLGPDPAVTVLQPLGPPHEAPGAGGGEPVLDWIVSFDLGEDVGVSRRDMRLELSGSPEIAFDGAPAANGFLRVLGGRFPVVGKEFTIERGIVRFGGGRPTDPSLDVDATFEASDGTRITAHVGGSLEAAQLTLTSDPPRSQSELLALILFGAPQAPGEAAPPGSAEASAGGAAGPTDVGAVAGGGALAAGLNQLLAQTPLPIQTRVSTSAANTRATASVEINDRLRLEYIRQFGSQFYGQQIDANIFALDWRFRPRWVLRTTVGDRGTTSFDLLWQKWY